ncbi:MAG: carboxypeptidase M32 [Erysipelotrichaceae bacterium]
MKMDNQQWFLEFQKKTAALRYAIATLSFECSTNLPIKAMAWQQEMMASLEKQLLDLEKDPQTQARLLTMDLASLDVIQQKALVKMRPYIEREQAIPKEVLEQFFVLRPKSEAAWIQAKKEQNYEVFKPYLGQMMELSKQAVAHLPQEHVYDRILDEREEGASMAMYDALFDQIKATIVPLLKQIKAKGQWKTPLVEVVAETALQKQYLQHLQERFGFDKQAGMMAQSAHPFCSGMSSTKVGFTVTYHDNPLLAVGSAMHEMGHAIYEQQSNEQYQGTILNQKSAAMHEGQSRFYEIMVGKSLAFWESEYATFQTYFPGYEEVSLADFYRMFNRVEPSLIRIEADELTYPLHIMIRYELEKQMFDGSLTLEQLPLMWNRLYHEYLGIEVPHDGVGILQDIHFSWGYFGYFPTYVLGSAYAAQIRARMQQDFDVDACLAKGELASINAWLKEHIHDHAGSMRNEELFAAMGEAFNPRYYCEYLVEKYTRLYEL